MEKPAEASGVSLDALLGALAEGGFALSPRERLKALQVFGLRSEWPPGELADVLAAVLATSPTELERLRATLRERLAVPQGLVERSSETEKSPNRWTRWLSWKGAPAAASFLAILAFAAFALLPRPQVIDDCPKAQDCTLYSDETRTFDVLGNDVAPGIGTKTGALVEPSQPETARMNADYSVTYTPRGKVGKERLVYELRHWSGTARGALELTVLPRPSPPIISNSTNPTVVTPPKERTRVYDVASLGTPVFHPNSGPPLLPLFGPLTISGGALALYGLYLAWARRRRRTDPPDWDPHSPVRFRPGEIGGPPPAWLLPRDLDQLAEVPVFLETDEESDRLDSRATVAGSARALRPELRFEHRRETLGILLLVDEDSAALAWNPLPRELVRGLEARGLSVEVVRFLGTLTRLYGRSQAALALPDFEEEQERLLVLVVSDGAGLYADDIPRLEKLAGFPRVAWLDPREPRFWDGRTELLEELGLPVFPASRDGVAAAFDALLSARGGQNSSYSVAELGRWGLRVRRQEGLRADVEEILGDALAWAASTAMIQPLSVGLAQKLRERFYPALPEMAIGRLFALPGTRVTAAGLRFGDPVLALLREGFSQLLTAAKEVQILQFLLAELAAVRPAQSEQRPGLALLAWMAIHERVRLELEPDDAAKKLARLAETPMGLAVRADLARLERPWDQDVPGDSELLPLRREPRTREAKAILDDLARRRAGKNPQPRRLVERRELAGVVLLGVALALSLWPIAKAWQDAARRQAISIQFKAAGPPGQRSTLAQTRFALSLDGKTLRLITANQENPAFDFKSLPQKVHLLAIGLGQQSETIWIRRDTRGGILEVPVLRKPGEKPCISEQPRGLITQLCPEFDAGPPLAGQLQLPSWCTKVGSAAGSSSLSIGIEIDPVGSTASTFQLLRDALLASSSVDLVYRIDGTKFKDALAAIERDLGPWVGETQILWWSTARPPSEFGAFLQRQTRQGRFASRMSLSADGHLAEWTGQAKLADDFAHELAAEPRDPKFQLLFRLLPTSRLPPSPNDIPLADLQDVRKLTFYPSGSENLSMWSQAVLAKVALQLAQEPQTSIVLSGSAPSQGRIAASRRLADVVASQLTTKLGIDPRRITTRGHYTLGPTVSDRDAVYLLTGKGEAPLPPVTERTFTVLATSDLAARSPGDTGAVDLGSFARFRTLRQQIETQAGEVLVLHAGGVTAGAGDGMGKVQRASELLALLDGDPKRSDPNLVVAYERPGSYPSPRQMVELTTEAKFTWLNPEFSLAMGSTLKTVNDVKVAVLNLWPGIRDLEKTRQQVASLREKGAEVVIAIDYNVTSTSLALLRSGTSTPGSFESRVFGSQTSGARPNRRVDEPDLIVAGGAGPESTRIVSRSGRFLVSASAAQGEAAVIRVRVRPHEPPVVEPQIVKLPETGFRADMDAVERRMGTSASPVPATAHGHLYALVVGISNYGLGQSGASNLVSPEVDARALAGFLEELNGKAFQTADVRVVLGTLASRQTLLAELARLAKNVSPEDTALVFLAGHSVMSEGQYAFVPFDGDLARPLSTLLTQSQLLEGLPRSKHTLLFLDTGPIESRLGEIPEGLAIFAATDDRHLSFDGPGYSAFSKALLEALSGRADSNGDGNVTTSELENYLYERVQKLTEGQQAPVSIVAAGTVIQFPVSPTEKTPP